MAALTLEQKKQRYSRDLAEHTLRQWNSLRENQARSSMPAKGRILTQSGTERHTSSRRGEGNAEIEHGDHSPRDKTPRRESKQNGEP